MERYQVGDTIAHNLMPSFPMPILEVDDCETDANRAEPHAAYRVVDPEGQEDWLCAYDVERLISR